MRLAIFCWVLFLIFLLWLVYCADSMLIRGILLVVLGLSVRDAIAYYTETRENDDENW